MATTYYTDIQKLYVAYFNRPADDAGLKYYEGILEAATDKAATLAVISADFAKSTEYTAAFSTKTSAEIVDIIYQNIFGHPADDAGKKYYADYLDSKALTVANVVTEVAKGAQGTDLIAFTSKVTAAAAFSAAIDTDAEKAGYSGDEANAVAKAWLAGVTDSLTLATVTAPAALNTTVGEVVAAGTVFTVASAMANLGVANDAMDAFLAAADGDKDATTSTDAATIAADLTTAQGDVVTDLGLNGATYTGGSASVKAAVIADQIAANATALTTAQGEVVSAQAAINAVSGLNAAVAALTAATTAADAADKAELNASADLAAKVAAYQTLNTTTITVGTDGTVSGLIVKSATTGALKLATNVTETTNPGVTALLAASVAMEAAETVQTNAHAVQDAAQLQVNHLDVSSANSNAEVTTLVTVSDQIRALGDITLAATAKATEAQIADEMAILTAKATAEGATGPANTNLTNFTNAVDAYHTAAEANPLVDALTLAKGHVTTAAETITTFTEDLAALKVAQSNADQLAGYNAQVTAAQDLFTAHDFNLVNNVAGTTNIGTSSSDVYVVGSSDATIALFGLQGTDSLYIGKGYTVNTAGTDKGNDAVLEAFIVSANSGADTEIVLETKVFGSNSADAEITITLTGVKAADVHLDANGIITLGGTAA
jgi:spore coat protein CotF